MSELQQKAVRMISGLSDDNISFLIEIINRLMPQNKESNTVTGEDVVKAIGMKDFKYFEDCLQDRCAESIDADYINEYAKAESSVLIYL